MRAEKEAEYALGPGGFTCVGMETLSPSLGGHGSALDTGDFLSLYHCVVRYKWRE